MFSEPQFPSIKVMKCLLLIRKECRNDNGDEGKKHGEELQTFIKDKEKTQMWRGGAGGWRQGAGSLFAEIKTRKYVFFRLSGTHFPSASLQYVLLRNFDFLSLFFLSSSTYSLFPFGSTCVHFYYLIWFNYSMLKLSFY